MEKRILTLKEVCELTGLSESYIYKLTHQRIIPFSKPMGKKLFFDREKIEAWMMSNPVKTKDEIEAEANEYISTKKIDKKTN